MKKYILLIPIAGLFYPPFMENWNLFVKSNYNFFCMAFIIQILSFTILAGIILTL